MWTTGDGYSIFPLGDGLFIYILDFFPSMLKHKENKKSNPDNQQMLCAGSSRHLISRLERTTIDCYSYYYTT